MLLSAATQFSNTCPTPVTKTPFALPVNRTLRSVIPDEPPLRPYLPPDNCRFSISRLLAPLISSTSADWFPRSKTDPFGLP